MKPKDKTRELIQNMEFKAGQDIHDRIISSIRTTHAQQPLQHKPVKKWACAAVAAIILILIFLAVKTPQRQGVPGVSLTMASTNMLSIRSMHLAFHNDGLEGLEEHLDASLTQVGPRPTETLMQGLYDNVDF
jgi:hypothetical protein